MTAPDDTVMTQVRSALREHGTSAEREAVLLDRVERWWPDLRDAVAGLHDDPDAVAGRLLVVAAEGFAQRPKDLHRHDHRRLLRPDWVQEPRMFGYACYTERFAGDLPGLQERLDHLADLGVTYLHLMPLLQPREGDNDGGYAVQDYGAVRPDLGTREDLRTVATRLRERGISLCVDLVLNHVAREHAWAEAARAGDAEHRAYFHVFADRALPDAYERTLPEVFPDFAPGSFTHDADLDGWVWTTFNAWQWDLNWANPAVLEEFARIVLDLANLGVEVLRLDAIAFLWKRLGTTCQNEPEVHAITQALRAVARIAAPAVLFKAEAIVGPRDLVQYLGEGPRAGRVSDLAYHNSLMVQIWSMLAARDTVLARHALASLPPTPATGTWITYVRCHDDIGWAIDDGDAAAVGLSGHAHRHFLSEWYAGLFPGSWADGLVFQHNEATGDRRISGTARSLAGSVERVLLAHAVVAAWGGVPVVWSGDELAQRNDPHWAAEPGHEDDNRWAHRPRLDDDAAARRHDPATEAGRVFTGLAHQARVRAGLPQLHASGRVEVLADDGVDPGLLVAVRHHPAGALVGIYNVTEQPRRLPAHRLAAAGVEQPHDALADAPVVPDERGDVVVAPLTAMWVVPGVGR